MCVLGKRPVLQQGYAPTGPGTWCSVAESDQRAEREDEAQEQEHPAREQYDHGTDGEQYGATGETREPGASELTEDDAD